MQPVFLSQISEFVAVTTPKSRDKETERELQRSLNYFFKKNQLDTHLHDEWKAYITRLDKDCRDEQSESSYELASTAERIKDLIEELLPVKSAASSSQKATATFLTTLETSFSKAQTALEHFLDDLKKEEATSLILKEKANKRLHFDEKKEELLKLLNQCSHPKCMQEILPLSETVFTQLTVEEFKNLLPSIRKNIAAAYEAAIKEQQVTAKEMADAFQQTLKKICDYIKISSTEDLLENFLPVLDNDSKEEKQEVKEEIKEEKQEEKKEESKRAEK
ncbi:MAG: hypothetical protein JWO53_1141 [Chlamydiia bacterium]|nr:hypothetical protein [Chlamydiia bacterium]